MVLLRLEVCKSSAGRMGKRAGSHAERIKASGGLSISAFFCGGDRLGAGLARGRGAAEGGQAAAGESALYREGAVGISSTNQGAAGGGGPLCCSRQRWPGQAWCRRCWKCSCSLCNRYCRGRP